MKNLLLTQIYFINNQKIELSSSSNSRKMQINIVQKGLYLDNEFYYNAKNICLKNILKD